MLLLSDALLTALTVKAFIPLWEWDLPKKKTKKKRSETSEEEQREGQIDRWMTPAPRAGKLQVKCQMRAALQLRREETSTWLWVDGAELDNPLYHAVSMCLSAHSFLGNHIVLLQCVTTLSSTLILSIHEFYSTAAQNSNAIVLTNVCNKLKASVPHELNHRPRASRARPSAANSVSGARARQAALARDWPRERRSRLGASSNSSSACGSLRHNLARPASSAVVSGSPLSHPLHVARSSCITTDDQPDN